MRRGLCLPGEGLTASPDTVGATGVLAVGPRLHLDKYEQGSMAKEPTSGSVMVSAWLCFRPFL